MDNNGFVIKVILFLLLATATEAIFFDYPKKALTDFLQSLKDKKETIKKSNQQVHHYHLHYYPVPVSLAFEEEVKVSPIKYELDQSHSEKIRFSGWSDHEYKNVPQSGSLIPTSNHRESWSNSHQIHESNGLTFQDQVDIAGIEHHYLDEKVTHRGVDHSHQTHISLHLPFHQEIIVQPPTTSAPPKEDPPLHPLAAFIQKLQNIKNSLFSYGDDKKSSSRKCEDKIETPAKILASKIRAANAAYAIYFHPRNLYKF